jgi:Flp pilus assembly protein TadD
VADDDDGAATLALSRRAQRLRARAESDSLPAETAAVDSTALRDSAAARLGGAATSGSQGGEAEASLAGNPLIEGIKLLEAGRTREAVPLLQRAAAQDPESAMPHGYLACAFRRIGEHRDADKALAKTGGVPGPWTGCARKR